MLALLVAASVALPAPPAKGRFVLDQANILTQQEYQQLEALAEDLDRSGDGQLGILVTNDLFGRADRKELAVDLYTAWGVGHKRSQGRDDGVLIVAKVTQPTRGVKVETGYDMEGRLNDGKVGAMVNRALPLFKDGKWGAGLIQLSSQIVTEMHAEGAVARIDQKPKKSESYWYIWAITAGILVMGGLAAVLILAARRRRLQAELEEARVRETRAQRDREQQAARLRAQTPLVDPAPSLYREQLQREHMNRVRAVDPVIPPDPPRREVPFVEHHHHDYIPPAVIIPIERPVERHYPRSEPSRSRDDDDDSTRIASSSSWDSPSISSTPDTSSNDSGGGFDGGSSGGGGSDTDV